MIKIKEIDVVKIVGCIILGMCAILVIMGLLYLTIQMWRELISLFKS